MKTLGKFLCLFWIWLILPPQISWAESANHDSNFSVGVIAPLTGALAEYGLAARNGIILAQSDHPQRFANIKFRFEDSQWDPKQAISAFHSLRTSSNLVFNWGNPTTEALAPLAEQLQFPLLGMSLDPAVAKGRRFVIRTTNPADDFSRLLAEHLSQKNYRRLGVVMAQNTYVQGLYDGLKRHLHSDQNLEVIASYPITENDFRSAITRIGPGKYDAIGVFLISGQVSTFYRQLQQHGLQIPSFGTDFFESTTEIKLSAGGMHGAVYPHLSVTPQFASKYRQMFGNDYQLAYAGNAHDIALLIASVFGSVKTSLDSAAVIKGLTSAPSVEGVAGAFRYRHTADADSYYEFPVHLKRITGEHFENITRAAQP